MQNTSMLPPVPSVAGKPTQSATTTLLRPMLRHEWRIFRSDSLLKLVVAFLALAIGYAIFNGQAWVARQQAAVAAAQQDEAGRLQRLNADFIGLLAGTYKPTMSFYNPSNASAVGGRHAATTAALGSLPLAATSVGQSDLYAPYLKVSTNNKDTFLFGEETDNPVNLLTGAFDLSFVVVFLLPLLVLALSYNLISGEKEQGTLAMVLSNPVRLSSLLGAKVGFRAALIFGLCLVFATAGLLLVGAPILSSSGLLALLLWGLLVAAYVLFWFALAVLVNLFGKGSAHNVLVLVVVWMGCTLVIPTAIGLLTQVLYPVPSRAEMVNNLRAAQTALNKEADATEARFYQDHPELDPALANAANDHSRAIRRIALQKSAALRVDAEMARYDFQLARQQSVVDWLRFLSPAIVMQQALNDVAGTGTRRFQDFSFQVSRFHDQWQGFFLPKVLADQPLSQADYALFPKFKHQEGNPGAFVSQLLVSLIGLAVPSLLLLLWSRRRLRRFFAV